MTFERRSRGSRFYRFFARRGWRWGSFAFVVICWTFGLTATGAAVDPSAVGTASMIAATTAAFAIVLGFFGILAALSRWVAEPAAERLIFRHAENPKAHPELADVRELTVELRKFGERQSENRERLARIEQSLEDYFARLQRVVSGPEHRRFGASGEGS